MVNPRIAVPALRHRLGYAFARSLSTSHLPFRRPRPVIRSLSTPKSTNRRKPLGGHIVTPWQREVVLSRKSKHRPVTVTVETDNITFSAKAIQPTTIPAIWLRDNCRCPECYHAETKQRLVDVFGIDENIAVRAATKEDGQVYVTFSDGHRGSYSMAFLEKQARTFRRASNAQEEPYLPVTWGSSIKENPPVVEYDAIMESDEGVAEWTDVIQTHGFSYVRGCPPTPEATQKLLERIAFIRHTHYGGFWDFTSDLASKDTAYTSIALDAHTDNTYFTDPARLQMFHLLSHTDGDGGASLLVDGFKAAMDLHKKSPDAYRTLANTLLNAHASGNDGISIMPNRHFAVFDHKWSGTHLSRVRWNNSDRASINAPLNMVEKWYWAAREWTKILRDSKNEYWEQLQPGTPLIFDNWRVLHGRSAFTGKRRICGGYINNDDFMSRHRTLHFPDGGSPV